MLRSGCGIRLGLSGSQSNYHCHILRIDHVAATREKVVVNRVRRSIGAKAGGNHTRAREYPDNHTDEAKTGGAIGCTSADVSAAPAAVQIVVAVGIRRRCR